MDGEGLFVPHLLSLLQVPHVPVGGPFGRTLPRARVYWVVLM